MAVGAESSALFPRPFESVDEMSGARHATVLAMAMGDQEDAGLKKQEEVH